MTNNILDDGSTGLLTDVLRRRGLTRRGFLRWTAMATALTGVAPILAACGGDDDDDDDDPDATQPPAGDATATTGAAPTSPPGGEGTPTEGSDADPTATTEGSADPTATTESPSELGSGGSLITGRSGDSDSLDPQRTVASASWYVFSNIFDSLVTVNMALEFEPVVAEAYEVSDDGLTYTWTIRDGVTFHDGSPLTVEDVKFTYDRATDADNPSQAASFIADYESSEIVDDKTIAFTMKAASAPFLSNIAVEYFGILPKAAVEAAGEDFGTQPIGSGPWVFEEWIQGEQITLKPYADYVNVRSYVDNKGAPLADELVFRVILEGGTLVAAFEAGEINHLIPPTAEVKRFQENSDYQVLIDENSTAITYIEFVTEAQEGDSFEPKFKAPFDDLRLRQAVAYGVNVEEMIESVLEGLAVRNFGLMPTGLYQYDPAIEEFGYHYDPEQAMKLLDEAGWTDANGDGVREKDGDDLELSFWAWTDPTYEKVVQVIQNQLGEIGIKLNLEVLEVGTMIARLAEGANNLNIMGVGWPEADIMHVMAYDISWGMGYYRPPEYIELIKGARQVLDQDERKEMYFEAQKIALADCACVPLWSDVNLSANRSEVKNFKFGPQAIFVWADAWVE